MNREQYKFNKFSVLFILHYHTATLRIPFYVIISLEVDSTGG